MGMLAKIFGRDKLELTDDTTDENDSVQDADTGVSSETSEQNDTVSPFLTDDDVQK